MPSWALPATASHSVGAGVLLGRNRPVLYSPECSQLVAGFLPKMPAMPASAHQHWIHPGSLPLTLPSVFEQTAAATLHSGFPAAPVNLPFAPSPPTAPHPPTRRAALRALTLPHWHNPKAVELSSHTPVSAVHPCPCCSAFTHQKWQI